MAFPPVAKRGTSSVPPTLPYLALTCIEAEQRAHWKCGWGEAVFGECYCEVSCYSWHVVCFPQLGRHETSPGDAGASYEGPVGRHMLWCVHWNNAHPVCSFLQPPLKSYVSRLPSWRACALLVWSLTAGWLCLPLSWDLPLNAARCKQPRAMGRRGFTCCLCTEWTGFPAYWNQRVSPLTATLWQMDRGVTQILINDSSPRELQSFLAGLHG